MLSVHLQWESYQFSIASLGSFSLTISLRCNTHSCTICRPRLWSNLKAKSKFTYIITSNQFHGTDVHHGVIRRDNSSGSEKFSDICLTLCGTPTHVVVTHVMYYIIDSATENMQSSLFVCLFVCLLASLHKKFWKGFAWNFQGRLAMGQWTLIKFWWWSRSRIRISTLVRRALAEICTVPVLLVVTAILLALNHIDNLDPNSNPRCHWHWSI